MTTPTGTITMSDIQTEFGGANPISLDEYYAGGAYVPAGTAGVPTSGTISMDDLRGKTAVNYGTLTPNFSTRVEGQSFTFTLAGGTVTAGTYYWKVVIVTGSATFTSTSGSFSVASNTGTFNVSTIIDQWEGTACTFYVAFGDSSGVPVEYVVSANCSVTDGTNFGTFSVTPSSRVEGSSFSCSLSGGNIPNGTYYWKTGTYSNMSASDLSSTTGSFTVTSGAGSFTVGTVQDTVFEGTGTFVITVGADSGVTNIGATSGTLSVTDYSSASATVDKTTIYRLGNLNRSTIITLTVSNAPVATYYWDVTNVTGTLVGSGSANTGDVVDTLTGSITTTGTTASNSLQAQVDAVDYNDGTARTANVFKVNWYADSGRTILVASTPNITIAAAPSYSFGSNSQAAIYRYGTAANRTNNLTFDITNISGTVPVYWTVTPTTVTTTDIVATSGSVTSSSGSPNATAVISVVANAVTLGSTLTSETYTVNIQMTSGGTTVASSTGASLRAAPTFVSSFSPTTINEGQSSILTTTPSNYPSTETLWYVLTGTATPQTDVKMTSGAIASSGSYGPIGPGAGSSTIYGVYDSTTDTGETCIFTLKASSTGATLAGPVTLTINNALGTVTTMTFTRSGTGATTLGGNVQYQVGITSIAAYPEARTFAITYNLNGGGYTNANLLVNSITVAANATSASAVTIWNTNSTAAVTSLTTQLTLAGHTTKTSTSFTSGYI